MTKTKRTKKPAPLTAVDKRALVLAQYSAVRNEILMLMESNEKRVFSGLSVAGTMTGILVSLASVGFVIPEIGRASCRERV